MLRKFVLEGVVMSECLTAPDAQTTIFVLPESSWRWNYHIRSVCERFVPEAFYLVSDSSCERLGAEITTFVASEGRAAMKVLDSQYLWAFKS